MFRCAEEITALNKRGTDDVNDTAQKNQGLLLGQHLEASRSITGLGAKKGWHEMIDNSIQGLRFISVGLCNVEDKSHQCGVESLEGGETHVDKNI